jgi:hypothetical protein
MLLLWFIRMGMEIIAEEKTLADLFHAIHMKETRGQVGKIKGHNDGGKALGPMQIHRGYWIDSKVKGKYEDCADLAYSQRVMLAYWNRYARIAVEMGDYEILARIHNGGPKGYLKAATRDYWNGKVIRKRDGSEIVKDKGVRHYLAEYRNR